MSKEVEILTSFLSGLTNIRNLINKTEIVERALEDLKLGKRVELPEVIDGAKKLLDDINSHTNSIKNALIEYNDSCTREECIDGIVNEKNIKEKNNIDKSNEPKENSSKGIKVRISNRNRVENITDTTELSEQNKDQVCKEPEVSNKDPDDALKGNIDNDDSNVENGEIVSVKDNTDTTVVDCGSNEEKNQSKDNSTEQNKENIDVPKDVPKIRVVDLSKLIDPQRKKSVKFDSSVIILTSSDEECSTPKKITNDRENGVLKSVLKKTPPINIIENKIVETNSKKRNTSNSRSSKRNRRKDSSSDNSGSEVETDRKKIKLKIKLNPLSAVSNNEISGSDSEESEADGKSRKSSRLKRKVKETENRQNKLKDKFAKIRSKITTSRGRVVKNRQDILKMSDTTSLSENSDSDEKSKGTIDNESSDESDRTERDANEKNKKKTRKGKRTEKEIPKDVDEKFKGKVFVRIPLIECHKLKEVYLNNKEILEIKKLTNMKSLLKKSRSKKNKNSGDQPDPENEKSCEEQPSNKKQNKSESNRSQSENEDSDNEKGSKDKNSSKASDNESPSDKEVGFEAEELILPDPVVSDIVEKDPLDADENMADLALNGLKDTEDNDDDVADDKTPNNSDEETDETKKSKKKKVVSDGENKDEECNENDQINDKNTKDDKNNDSDDGDDKSKQSNTQEKDEDEGNDKQGEDKNDDLSDKDNNSDKESDKESNKSNEDDKTKKKKSNDDESEDDEKKKKGWKKDKLLTEKIDSTDSEEEFSKFQKKKRQKQEESGSDSKKKQESDPKRKAKRGKRAKNVISDSDESCTEKTSDSSSEEESAESADENEEDKVKKKSARKRIKRVRDSSSSDDDKSTRKHIRKVLDRDSLSETTKKAEAEEKERKARIAEKQKRYNNIFEEKMDATIDKVVLEYDEKDDTKEVLSVDKRIVEKLKPHQANGIRFMWDACFENLKRATKEKGSGCILAHCMGLGKTLQVIALCHTLIMHSEKTEVNKVLVVCPVNTVLNWKAEFKKWLPKKSSFDVYELATCKQNAERCFNVNEWHEDGGVLIIGYTMFRNLSTPDNKKLSKKMRETFAKGLVDPGPDLVICDEGHLLKNEKTFLSIAMNRIKTARRIVLTGTPLQNNLKEYWCMVQFIKPNLLGTYKEYLNRFVNPIINGQYTDSTQRDIMLMRKRSHVLHKLLDGVVQRRDYSVLEPYLPPKYEYVLFVKLSPVQIQLYKHYMEKYARKQSDGSNRTSFLFTDFQQLQRICTHPRVLADRSSEKNKFDDEGESESEGSLKDFIDDNESGSSSAGSSSSSSDSADSDDSRKKKKTLPKTRLTRAQAAQRRDNNEDSEPELVEVKRYWWQDFCDGDELDNIQNSGKLSLLFQILKECEDIGDKVLIFSQSLLTLNCIEYFLEKIDESTQAGNSEKVGGYTGSWALGLDYFRLDGSSSCDNRATWCDSFNNPSNTRARLFLISTKAGGLGINLVAANRVIIFDVSWNPSHDVQSIYRVYRFGQTKPSYIYRFVTYGAMEMKIYERQVTKQAISKRVIDEQQIDRHYNQNDLQELYKCDLEPEDRPIPLVPKDVLLGEMLQNYSDVIYKYHIHQSLLENKEDEGLNEEERKAAWEEFENEKVMRQTYNTGMNMNIGVNNVNPQLIASALRNIVRNDNPTWSEVQINGIIPALVQQLQTQLAENDTSMYSRVTQEIQRMHMQKTQEFWFQQQLRQMQARNAMLGNYYVDPNQVRNMAYSNVRAQSNSVMNQAGPSMGRNLPVTNDVIDLND